MPLSIPRRYYNSLDLQLSLALRNFKESVLFLLAMSGCDTISSFLEKGKLIVVKFYNKNYKLDKMVTTFNCSNMTQEDIDCTDEKCISALNKTIKVIQSLDEFRFITFNSSVETSKKAVNFKN